MNNWPWLKTGKGMVSQLMDVVSPTPQAMPISNKRKKENGNVDTTAVLFTSLNQDSSYVCCGTDKGFKIFRSYPFEKVFESNDLIPLRIAMLFDKSLVAALTHKEEKKSENNYKLQLYDIKNREEIWRIDIKFANISFAVNKTRLVLSLSLCRLCIFDITNKMKRLHPEIITYNGAIFDLCSDSNNCLLAYEDQSGKGRICIMDAYNLQKRLIIKAHDSCIQIIKFNENGTLIASASKHGTLIRVFSLKLKQNKAIQIATFRRGTFDSKIKCLAFNPSSSLLCCSSLDSNTIHIFSINFNHVVTVTDYLPISVKNTIEYPRSCVAIQIKSISNNKNNIQLQLQCGFINDNSIVIATQNGYFYRYLIIVNKINKTKLLSEHSLKQGNIDLDHKTKIFHIQQEEKQNIKQNKDDNDDNDNNNNNNNESPESQSPEIFARD